MLGWLWCLMRGRHEPTRQPVGGFRCRSCGRAGADLEDMGFTGAGYVSPLRRVYRRKHGELTRTSSWETGRHAVVSAR